MYAKWDSLSGCFVADGQVENYKDDLVETLKTVLQIRSVEGKGVENYPFGKELGKCLEKMLEKGLEMGFGTQNHQNYVGCIETGVGDRLVGILAHLDVVPEGDESQWCFAPYGGVVSGNKIYGRGALDDKGPAVAALYAMKALKDVAYPFQKRVRLILGTNEETHAHCIQHYLNEGGEIPEYCFTPDSDFPVIHGEKGILRMVLAKTFDSNPSRLGVWLDAVDIRNEHEKTPILLSISGGERFNMVPESAEAKLSMMPKALKASAMALRAELETELEIFNARFGEWIQLEMVEEMSFKVRAQGISAHGSTPEHGRNAISCLMMFLDEFFKQSESFKMENPEMAQMLTFYGQTIGQEYYGQSFNLNFKDELSGNLIFNVGVLTLNEAGLHMEINIRYPITSEYEAIMEGIHETIGSYGIEVAEVEHTEPICFSKDHPLIQSLMRVYNGFYNTHHEPITIGGGTYARSMPNTVAFGPLHPGQEDCMHQKNECVGIDHLLELTKLYARAIVALDQL